MTCREALERWEKKIVNCEVKPQSIWPIVMSLIKRDVPEAPTAIQGPLGFKYQPIDKANAIAEYFETQFTPHDLCDKNHKRRVEARVQA
jgi:hypothetical protein